MPGMWSTPSSSIPCTISITSAGCGMVAGLTSTRPATSGCWKAVHRLRLPPIDRPATTTRSVRAASRWYAASTSAVQSAHRVPFISSTVVPWPGRRGSSTENPAAANASARPRIELGLPVKPWRHRAPAGPPSADQGSAPGRSGSVIPCV